MRRKSIFLLAGMLFVLTANAQDVIKLRDGREVQAKISDITQDEIKYKNYDYQDGPTFTIDKSDVLTIQYANGVVEEIKAAPKLPKQQQEESGSFWKPELWTNQHPAAISGYIDLGGKIMSGAKIGVQARWRRLEASIAYKGCPSRFWWSIGDDTDDAELQSLEGKGFNYTFRVYLPTANSNNVFHVGMANEITDLNYVYVEPNNDNATDTWWATMYSTGLGGGMTHYMDNGLFFRGSVYLGLSVMTGYYKYEHYSGSTHSFYWSKDQVWFPFYGTVELAVGFEIPLIKK